MEEEKKEVSVKLNEQNLLAALSYLSVLSVVFYILKKDDEFIRFHAQQGMVIMILSVVGVATSWIFGLGFLVSALAFVLMVIGALKAYKGEKFRIPGVADLAAKINF